MFLSRNGEDHQQEDGTCLVGPESYVVCRDILAGRNGNAGVYTVDRFGREGGLLGEVCGEGITSGSSMPGGN
jgi:hypothetical protein